MEGDGLRLARASDAAAILAIYAPYVLETAITFEYEVPTPAAFAGRIEAIASEYPYLICASGGRIAGYACAHRNRERAAYQWNAELSVYIDRACRGRGMGRALYGALIEILGMQNVRNVYGAVTCPNEASERLHESLGFRRLGTYHGTGYKCGAWHDVAWFERAIGERGGAPGPFVPIARADPGAIAAALDRHGGALRPR